MQSNYILLKLIIMKLLRVDGTIIIELEGKTIKQLVEHCALNKISLRGAYLRGADLQDADLRGAYLQGAYLQDAYLRGADLRGADLRGADLRGADLQDAYLQGADLQDAKNIFTFNKVNGRTCFANIHGDKLKIQAGCFWGTLSEFEEACKKKYPNDPIEAYEAQIAYLKILESQIK